MTRLAGVSKGHPWRWSGILLCSVTLGLVLGCAGGPRPLDVSLPGAEAENVIVIEYAGSDIGDPVPAWVSQTTSELESQVGFQEIYAFMFALEGDSLEAVQDASDSFPEARSIAGAVIERALARTEGIDNLPDDLVDRAVRVLAAVEYVGTDREGEFWVHEQVLPYEEEESDVQPVDRYRGWLLYTVPRDQVFAALVLAYENAQAAFPPITEPERAACEALQARFVDGL